MIYNNPQKYWTERGITYPSEVHERAYFDFPGKQEVIDILEKLKPASLLDLGCGSGRLFHLYKNVKRVVGADFSNTMLTHANKLREKEGYTNIELVPLHAKYVNNLRELFDIVLTRNFLMHIPYNDIVPVVESIKKVCRKYALFIEYVGSTENLSPHCFSHNYPELFYEFKVNLEKEVNGNTVFLLERKKI